MVRKSNNPPRRSGLIETKIRPPASNDDWVARPRLVQSLNEGHQRRLTAISAPAGFGKTVLALQWLQQLEEPCAWLSLDERDNDENDFFRYLTAAVCAGVPGLEITADRYLNPFQTPPPSVSADQLLSDFRAHRQAFTVVLDDVHVLRARPVLSMLSRLIGRLPPTVRFLLLGRTLPSLPLSKLRSSHQLHLISAEELQFTKGETDAFLTRAFGKKSEPQIVDVLYERSDGWIAALALARLSLTGENGPGAMAERLGEARTGTADFLMNEVVETQPRFVQVFLCASVLFDRFTADLLDAAMSEIPDLPPAQSTIDLLARENLLLMPLDDKRGWYRCHDLKRQLLTQRLSDLLGVDALAEMRRRSGAWLAKRGFLEEAIKQYLAAGDEDAAAAVLAQHITDILDEDVARRTLRRFIEMFPKQVRKKNVVVVAAEIYLKCGHWDIAGAVSLLALADALLADPASPLSSDRIKTLRAELNGARSFFCYWKGDPEGALQAGRAALENTPLDQRHWAYLAVMYTGASLAMLGRADEAVQLLSSQTTAALAAGNRQAGAFLTVQMGICHYSCDLTGARQIAEAIIELYEQGATLTYWYVHAHYFLGSVAYEQNCLAEAERHFETVRDLRYQVNTRPGHDGLLGLALICLARKNWEEAEKRAAFARAFAREVKDPHSVMFSESLRTRQALVKGDTHLVPTVHLPQTTANFMWLENPVLTYAEHLMSTEDADKAAQAAVYLAQVKEQLLKGYNRRQHLQLDAVRAAALYKLGKREAALDLLRDTLKEAELSGLVRTFLDRGETMAAMLADIVRTGGGHAYAAFLLRAFEEDAAAPESAAPLELGAEDLGEPPRDILTRREREVLHHLQGFASIKEIAAMLFVSPQAVKKHTLRIYRKLKVNKRVEAVAAAKKLGLL